MGYITGMKIDPTTGTYYLSTSTGSVSYLYTLNTATGYATLIGSQFDAPAIIDIAISGDDQIYATDISTGKFYRINKADGAATLIGPLGFDITGAQGMDFDYSTNTLYAALSKWGDYCYFSTIDLSTGAATPKGDLRGQWMDIAINSPFTPVPEPGILILLGISMVSIAGLRRWWK